MEETTAVARDVSMHPNPFSPSFSVLPQAFYGRSAYLTRFAEALDDPSSANRYLLYPSVLRFGLSVPGNARHSVLPS